MEVNSNKQKRAELRAIEKAKQKEILAKHKNTVKYRLLTILGLDIIAISFLTYINNESSRTYNFVFKVLPVLTIIAAALTVAAAVYLIISKVKKINTSLFPVTPAMIFSSMLTMLGVCLLYKHMTTTKLILALIVLTVLYFVYHLYSRTFFKYSLFTAGAMFISEFFGVVSFGSASNAVSIAARVVAIIVAVIILIFALIEKSGKKSPLALLDSTDDWYIFAVTAAVLTVEAVVAFVSLNIAAYITLALVASYLVIAIIYTIKMI